MSVNFQIVGKRVKEVRKRKRLSQAQLAEMSNISTQYLSQIETAKKQASLQSLVSISNALEISVDELLTGNRLNGPTEYIQEVSDMFTDCTRYEKRVMYETLNELKRILRENESLIEKEDA